MKTINIKPTELAENVYNSLTNLEKKKINSNISNFGKSIFKAFDFSEDDKNTFILSLQNLITTEA